MGLRIIVRSYLALILLLTSADLWAQPFFIKPLNDDLLTRWMQTTLAIKPHSELLDSMQQTEAEALAFEALPAHEQDKQVEKFLIQHNVDDQLNRLVKSQGWRSVGDYMRASAQVGNAMAAYFQEDILAKLPAQEAKAMRERVDPAIAKVSDADLAFVRKNISVIQKFMQDYSAL